MESSRKRPNSAEQQSFDDHLETLIREVFPVTPDQLKTNKVPEDDQLKILGILTERALKIKKLVDKDSISNPEIEQLQCSAQQIPRRLDGRSNSEYDAAQREVNNAKDAQIEQDAKSIAAEFFNSCRGKSKRRKTQE